MDLLDIVDRERLLSFFHRHKTEMSSMDNPHTFLRKLRDHNLIPEDRYQKMSRMKSKKTMERAVYDFLDWLEREHPECITEFWKCAFKEAFRQQYPTLQQLYNGLMDDIRCMPFTPFTPMDMKVITGAYHVNAPLPDKVEKEKIDEGKWQELAEKMDGEKEKTNLEQKKGKRNMCNVDGDNGVDKEEQAGTSSSLSPALKKKPKTMSNFPVIKVEKTESELPVTWRRQQREKSMSPPIYVSDEDEESEKEEEQAEKQPEANLDQTNRLLQVKCGDKVGTLHTKRFASGVCGRCIHTETGWMTPEQFLRAASLHSGASWKKDIKWDEIPLGVLVEAKTLRMHSVLCDCFLCKQESTDLEKKKNNECLICKSGGEDLVACDECPRSFHPKCHLPHVDVAIVRDSSPWMCTFCVFRSNQQYYYPNKLSREATMSAQISQHLLRCQYLLLHVSSADQEQTFAFNPALYVEDYSTVIKTPMWLRKIAEKLQVLQYKTVGEFVSDIQLIFINWASYNRDNAESCARAKKLKNLFDSELKKAFNI